MRPVWVPQNAKVGVLLLDLNLMAVVARLADCPFGQQTVYHHAGRTYVNVSSLAFIMKHLRWCSTCCSLHSIPCNPFVEPKPLFEHSCPRALVLQIHVVTMRLVFFHVSVTECVLMSCDRALRTIVVYTVLANG